MFAMSYHNRDNGALPEMPPLSYSLHANNLLILFVHLSFVESYILLIITRLVTSNEEPCRKYNILFVEHTLALTSYLP